MKNFKDLNEEEIIEEGLRAIPDYLEGIRGTGNFVKSKYSTNNFQKN